MLQRLFALVRVLLALAFAVAPATAQDRGVTVDDIVGLEAFGRAAMSPDGRWAIYEKRGRYDGATRFDLGQRASWTIMDLWLVDLRRPGAAPERLLSGEGPGLLRGSWSPSGKRFLVYRFTGARLEIGVVTMSDRSVRWTGLTPEMPQMGASAEWRSDDEVVVMVRRDSDLPWLLRYYNASQARTTQAWARTASGREPSRTVVDTSNRVPTAEGSSSLQRLVLLHCTTGTSRPLFEGVIVDFALSPDGGRMAVIEGVAPRPLPSVDVSQSEIPWIQRLVLLDPDKTAGIVPDEAFEVAPHLLRWSPDSSAVLVWGRAIETPWRAGDLKTVGRHGEVTTVDRHGLDPMVSGREIDLVTGIRADWLGSMPILFASPPEGGRRDWYALPRDGDARSLTSMMTAPPDQVAAVSVDGVRLIADGASWRTTVSGAWRETPAGAGLKLAAPYDVETPFRLRVNAAPRQTWATAMTTTGGVDILTRTKIQTLGIEDGGSIELLASTSSSALALKRAGLSEALVLLGPGQARTLDRVNAGLSDVALVAPTPVDHLDASGRPTRSWLFLPPARSGQVIKGVVVSLYPGAASRGAWSGPLGLTYGVRPAVLVGEGYAVLSASIPGSDYGDDPADFFTRSADLAFDAAIAAHPELPEDRAAILGHSFGGYAALAVATRSTRFRSYIAWASTTDMLGAWGEFTPVNRAAPEEGFMMLNQQGWVETGQAKLGEPPFGATARYAKASPYLAADHINSPVLLITADMDFVTTSQSERMFSALSRLGQRARLVTYLGEEHFNWSPANIRDLYGQIFDWLDLTLAKEDLTVPGSHSAGSRP